MTGGELKWQRARLMPITGITGPDEEERRGTSLCLSVLSAVQEYGRAITARLGAPAGTIETFIECEFPHAGKMYRPDGVIRVHGRRDKVWTALVEVKTRRNLLQVPQVEIYMDIAREQGFDAVVTISPQLSDLLGGHPLRVDKKKSKKTPLFHLSWSEIHTEALIEQANHAVSQPDQAWILAEFIRYVESPRSGALEFDDMGASWVAVREAAIRLDIRPSDPRVMEVVDRIGQLVSYAGMRLSQRLGVVVRPALTHRDHEEPAPWAEQQIAEFVKSGRVTGALTVPNAVGPIRITADLRSGRVECCVSVAASANVRPLTRVNSLLRQLHDPPKDLMIQAKVAHARANGPSHLIGKVQEDPAALVEHPKADIREFVLTLNRAAGTKRGVGRGTFIDSVLTLVEEFYSRVVQELRPPVPGAPKVKGPNSAGSDDDTTSTPVVSSELPSVQGEAASSSPDDGETFESIVKDLSSRQDGLLSEGLEVFAGEPVGT